MAERGPGPAQAAVVRERRLHIEQVRGHRFVAGWGPKRSATIVPAPLRYWQYQPARPAAVAFTVVIVAAWLGVFGWSGGWPAAREEMPLALTLGLVVLVLNTSRTTVSDHGVSFDVAATRTEPPRVVPLARIRAVHAGRVPDDWPTATRRGGWWPGRTRVGVRCLGDDGQQSFTLWVRDPHAFATASGVPLDS